VAKTQDVVIIGGGAVGAACAREMAQSGRSVLVVEPGDRAGEAWRTSAGLLSPQIGAQEDDPLFELGIAGREYYRDLAAPIREETGIDISFYDGGILRIARGEAEEIRLKEIVAWQRQHGHRVDWLDPGEVRSDWSWVGELDGALWAPADGSINPIRLVEALRASAKKAGARFVADSASALVIEGSEVTAVRGAAATYPAGAAVLAAGAWSGRLQGLPRPVSVEPVRGQIVAKPWPERLPPAIVYGTDGYVLERDGEAICGATVEHAGFAAEVTKAGVRSVEQAATSLVPRLGELPIARSWAGLRPGTPDGLPIVGAEPSVPNLWYATGHGRNGILLAGITAVILGHRMADEATFEGVEALRPERFWSR
jgi:glycine oxidase